MSKKLKMKLHDSFLANEHDISQQHLEKTITLSQDAYQKAEQPRPFHPFTFFISQVQFVGVKIWGLQALLLLFQVVMLTTYFMHIDIERTPVQLPLILSAFGVMMALPGIPFIERSIQYKMLEIEMTSFVSLPRLLLTRLIIIASGSVAALAVMLVVINRQVHVVGYDAASAIYYLVLSFLLACVVCLLVVDRIRSRYSMIYCFMLGAVIVVVLNIIRTAYPSWFQVGMGAIHWIIICVIFTALCIELLLLIRRSKSLDKLPVV